MCSRKRLITISLLFLFATTNVFAQKYCKRISLFFDLNQSELTDQSKKKLDSIILYMNQQEFLVEMYGHADSLASADYNFKLAGRRMQTVRGYIISRTKSKLDFKEKNLGETNDNLRKGKENNMAYNRRVDIFLIPKNRDKIILQGNRGESIELPLNYFEPCGVCNSVPTVNTYYTQAEGKDQNLLFQTSDGTPLITGGTFIMNSKTCKNGKLDTSSVVIKIPVNEPDPEMSVWEADTINGKICWKPSRVKLGFDPIGKKYVINGQAGRPYNVDKKVRPEQITKCSIVLDKVFNYKHTILTPDQKTKRDLPKGDSLSLENSDTVLYVHGFARIKDTYYHFDLPMDSVPLKRNVKGNVTTNVRYAKLELYREFEHSDTTVKVRFKKSIKPEQFGYYLKEYNEFIPVTEFDGKYYQDKKLIAASQYAYIKKGKLYVIDNKNLKIKYSAETNTQKIKFGRKLSKKFRSVKEYKVGKH